MKKVRPRGWGFLVVLCIIVDILQAVEELFGLLAGLTGIGIVFTIFAYLLSGFESVFLAAVLFVWHGHNEVPNGFKRALIPTVMEIIPGLNWLPFWTIYAFTYWVDAKPDMETGTASAGLPPNRGAFTSSETAE